MISKLVLLMTLVMIVVLAKKKTKKRKWDAHEKEEKLNKFIEEDEGPLMEPYIGGYNSDQATILTVTFHSLTDIRARINQRWHNERDMVLDI